jgi:hypothetical protein
VAGVLVFAPVPSMDSVGARYRKLPALADCEVLDGHGTKGERDPTGSVLGGGNF